MQFSEEDKTGVEHCFTGIELIYNYLNEQEVIAALRKQQVLYGWELVLTRWMDSGIINAELCFELIKNPNVLSEEGFYQLPVLESNSILVEWIVSKTKDFGRDDRLIPYLIERRLINMPKTQKVLCSRKRLIKQRNYYVQVLSTAMRENLPEDV